MPSSLTNLRPDRGRVWQVFGLNAPAGQTAAPGNATMNFLSGCGYTLPAGSAQVGGQLRIWVAGRKGNTAATTANTEVMGFGMRCGTAGTSADPFLASFGTVNTSRIDLTDTTRSFGFMHRWRFESNTLIRRMGAVAGVASESAQVATQVALGTTDTIPNIATSAITFRLHGSLTVGTAEWIVIDELAIEIIDPFST
jgi:hypothetical protein